ncbi:MAG: membrane protein insertase YidC [Aquabacterium sp.]|jgi:YidC/Oxa1 family membrane protein insertase|nr:MAG: membrane protein insertase YidC [Aquabacterium sp.]
MTDTRRTILLMVFLFSLFSIWDAWNRHNGRPGFFDPPAAQQPVASAAAPGAASAAAGASSPAGTVTGGAAQPAVAVSELTVVSTDLLRATLDSVGGSLVKLELLKHADAEDPKKPVVLFDRSAQHTYVAYSGLEDVPGAPGMRSAFKLAPGPRTLADGSDDLVVRYESPADGGVKLVKQYTFVRGSYAVKVRHEVVNTGSQPVTPKLDLRLVRDNTQPAHAAPAFFGGPQSYTGPAFYTSTAHYQKVDFKHIDENSAEYQKNATDGWVAMVQHYFASAWVTPDALPREFYAGKSKTDPHLYEAGMRLQLGTIGPDQTKAVESTLFAGPQEEKKLEVLAPGLELVKDYGWVTILAKPLFWLLDKIHGLVGNWGWAIILLVLLLKAAFYWLNASAYRSMAKMKAVNPRIMEMRERLKDKPQQMQQEMMKIYREEKVNPLGGCLPIVVQIPVFIALYSVLLASVEMRGAPWVLWIHDLGKPDALFGHILTAPVGPLPLLMMGSTMLQTWLNPTPPDPVQAKLMWIMPLAFSVMFFFFPAGLVLYWLTNNLLSIAQQWFINKRLGVN